MKTNVRTKLGWSKLILISMIFAVVAMLTVLGLFFTNANADDTADPANAELNIPVSILDTDLVKAGKWKSTDWTLQRSQDYTNEGAFPGHTYNIVDNDYQWTGDSGSAAVVEGGNLIITIDTDFKGTHFYKNWAFECKKGVSWYIFTDGKATKLIEKEPFSLSSSNSYSFFLDQPQEFRVQSKTKDATRFNVKGNDFDNKPISFQDSLPYTFALNSKALEASIYYNENYTLILKFDDKYILAEYNLTPEGKIVEGTNYAWTLNDELISSDKDSPTKLKMEKLEKYPLIFDKGSEPTPPEPITSFKVKGIIKDVDGNPIPNATVGFYNAEMDADLEEPMVSALTDENGYFVLEGCSTGTKDPESGLKITYAAKHYGMDEFSFNYKDIIGGEVTLTNIPELDSALVDLYSDSPQHKSFTITEVRQEKGKEPEIRYCRNLEYYGISELSSNGIDNPVFNISDNGVLVNVYTDEEETTTTTIAPNGQDGYIFDNYVINDKATYRVGDSVDISQPIQEDHYVKISTNYTVDTSKIAKTSDANIYVVAGLLAIVAAAGTLLVLRRRKQDF